MKQNRPPKTVQLVIDPFEQPVSGAELRNDAVKRALMPFTDVTVVSPKDFAVSNQRLTGNKSAPTLLAPDETCVQNFVKYIGHERPDILLFEGVGLLKFCEALVSQSVFKIPRLVLDFHNVESALWEENVFARMGVLRRLWKARRVVGARESVRLADREAVRLSDAVLVPTGEDRQRLTDLVGDEKQAGKIRVVPNIAPSWALRRLAAAPVANERGGIRRLLFVGHLRYTPNVEAVDALVHRIWPQLRGEFLDMRLVIAGRNPARRVRRWAGSRTDIELHADPSSLDGIYDGCDVAIMPLRQGGGSRLKVLEAFAVGMPVIATAKAVEGLGLTPDRHWLRAETAQDYVAAIRRLIRDPGLGARLVGEGRALVAERYTDKALADTLAPIIRDLNPQRA
ncbi:glycosyltransferase family 4 protein [Hoeflea poritis]|uniref:Glycosyltransferase family 4 protein n=1 Tax=Hoeflea poritis TaxID=2993659 RepID=A0ABT4VMV6_9HYPH|nr:glycosyltransferase family 4 protein [Hoeflea poritis]MDA4846016.1 glycosyltransferase family 4 protein [Hoeflea poritis]